MDNILLMQEIVRGYHRDHGPPKCAIKLDIMKAYNSEDWDFLFAVMIHMEFPTPIIQWVRACVSSPWYSIVINGELKGFYPGKRGLRQGDPISPYLFLLIMEAFSSFLQARIDRGNFSYHPNCALISLSHLAFADMFIMCGATAQSFEIIDLVLNEFYLFFGLQPNLHKSACFMAGVGSDLKLVLNSILNIPEASLPVKYFGVPLISTKLKYSDCLVLKLRMLARIQSWTNKSLSFGGRAQLISSVFYSAFKFTVIHIHLT